MQDILSESIKRLKRRRIKRIWTAAVLVVLSLAVSLDVFWSLRQPGWTLAGDADCGIVEHSHDVECAANCSQTEHVHTVDCYSDDTADLESQLNWQQMFKDYPYTGKLATDLVGIAKTQVGYSESQRNFEMKNGIRNGYTRYGAWYGTPYSEWSATFVSFCLHYAGADQNNYPFNTGAAAMAEQWKQLGKYVSVGSYKPRSGDLVFFKDNTVGIVCETQTSTFYIIQGDLENEVKSTLISYVDENISGWGIVNKQISTEELYDISNGPAVFIFADGIIKNNLQTYNLRNSRAINDLITYLNANGGSYYFTLLDTSNRELPKDNDGNFIVHAGTQYKITLTTTSPDGFSPGTYRYQFPEGVEMVAGTGNFVINDVTVGNWEVTADGQVTLIFNQEANKLSDVTISATMGIIYPEDKTEMDFDGKINVTIEPPREEIEVTEVQKWGEQGNPDNADIIDKNHKLDPNKIYWTVQIEGNQTSNIPGSAITDQTLKYDWSYDHHYSDTDRAAGLKFGVSIHNHETGTEEWHAWTVYPGEDLIWTENGWEYTMPETVMCTKNANSPHQIVLGNEHYTYYIEYTSTPTHVDIAGQLEYANEVEVDNKRQEGWAGFTQKEVKAAIFKRGTLITDAGGAKILWEVQATIPKKQEGQRAERDWIISDGMYLRNEWKNKVYHADNDVKFSSITANYFGTTINIPHYSVATENDPYAYDTYSWSDGKDNGAAIHILQRCVCTEETCGESGGVCSTWEYHKQKTAYCDCWREIEDTTFTITYETDVTDEIKEFGNLGYSVYNGVGLTSKIYTNVGDEVHNNIWTGTAVPIPGIIQKQDLDPEGALVKYNITVNESKLNLTDGAPLVIHDEMTETLTFMRGSLVIKSEDADGNIVTLQEDVDYTYTYQTHDENGGHIVNDNGEAVHVLEVTILHPQPVTYILDYNTMIIMEGATSAIKYNNMATISLWGGSASSSSEERYFPDIAFASNALSVMVHKLSAVDDQPIRTGAKFGLFNAQGGLITTGVTDANGKVFFQTDIQNGIVLREHVIYYVQELEAPPGYRLDETKHEFTFCNSAEGECETFNELQKEHDITRVPFKTIGHIDITNEALTYDLPQTGGIGTYPLLLVSMIFIIIPLVYMFIAGLKMQAEKVTDNYSCLNEGSTVNKKRKKERKKIMKKLITVFLALAMIFAMSIPAFAADATVTIGTDANHSYKGYQLMTLTTSLKCAENHEHGKECYNYAYSVNAAYLDALIAAINQADVDTAEEVIAYIDTLADDSAAMNTLAKAIYDNIADKSIGTTITGNNATELAQGYWLFADVTNLGADANDAISFIMVKTQGQEDLVINPKVGLPEVTKEVEDLNDTTGEAVWGESADADIGDYVDFKLTATLGDYFDSYETYKLIFHDDLGTGFALDDTAKASIAVKVYADDTKAQELTLENNAYTINYTTADAGCDFEVIFNDITTIENISKNAVFEVTYKAKLTDTAVVGETGNPNTVTLEYSNNPYDENSTGEDTDNVVVYTYKLIIDKKALAEDGAALPGAGFTLYKMVDGEKTEIAEIEAADDRTQFVWTGLDDGDYILEESTVPAGYNKMTDLEFTITANHTLTNITGLAADGMTADAEDGTINDIVVNNTGTVLPETGGMGTMWLIFGGAMLVILAGVVMITRKKMSVYED